MVVLAVDAAVLAEGEPLRRGASSANAVVWGPVKEADSEGGAPLAGAAEAAGGEGEAGGAGTRMTRTWTDGTGIGTTS